MEKRTFDWGAFKKRLTAFEQEERTVFDPMLDVPKTDEQVEIALRFNKPDIAGKILIGIYNCGRGEGKSLIEAYKEALETYVRVSDPVGYEEYEQMGNQK